jgi:TadE-like protein
MHSRHRGAAQALVEAALVFPLAIGLSLGIVQVVLYVHARDVLLSAVQEGARLASEDGRSLDEGVARARDLVTAGLGRSAEPVLIDGTVDDELVTLRADADLRPILPLPMVSDLPLRAVGRVARERFRPGGGRS